MNTRHGKYQHMIPGRREEESKLYLAESNSGNTNVVMVYTPVVGNFSCCVRNWLCKKCSECVVKHVIVHMCCQQRHTISVKLLASTIIQ